MTTADGWTRTVREQLGLGRLLPLGEARDGAWIAERAARAVLVGAAGGVAGVWPGGLRIGLASPEAAGEPSVPAPPGALPPGPLRVTADFAVAVDRVTAEPLPVTASRLRAVLAEASGLLGLVVTDVDLRVTGLLDALPGSSGSDAEPRRAAAVDRGDEDEVRVAEAVGAVAGVARLTGVLGRAVQVSEVPGEVAALARRHVRVEVAVDAGLSAVEVARRVREVVTGVLLDRPSVAVVVTGVG